MLECALDCSGSSSWWQHRIARFPSSHGRRSAGLRPRVPRVCPRRRLRGRAVRTASWGAQACARSAPRPRKGLTRCREAGCSVSDHERRARHPPARARSARAGDRGDRDRPGALPEPRAVLAGLQRSRPAAGRRRVPAAARARQVLRDLHHQPRRVLHGARSRPARSDRRRRRESQPGRPDPVGDHRPDPRAGAGAEPAPGRLL